MMRTTAVLLIAAGCATEPGPDAPSVDLLDLVWSDSIRPGDLVVAVPGTGMYTDFGARIDAKADGGELPMIDARQHVGAVEVLEGVIAAARRAGVDPATVDFALWGAGVSGPEILLR